MLNILSRTKDFVAHLPLAQPSPSLQCFMCSTGLSVVETLSYKWNGLKRGDSPFAILQWTLEGRGKLRYEMDEFDLREGELFIVQIPHDHQYWFPENGKPWKFAYLILEGSQAMSLTSEILSRVGPVINLSACTNSAKLFGQIIVSSQKGEVKTVRQASALGYSFLMSLIDEITLTHSLLKHPDNLARTLDFVEKNYSSPIGVDEMANAAGMSRSHFSRLFKKAYGATPVEYLSRLRLNHAARLLHTPTPLKEVARLSGFTDVNYFCRAFKLQTGSSPGLWRRRGM